MLITISVTVIAAIMLIAVGFLIPVLLRIRRVAREVEKVMETTRLQIVPLSHDLTIIAHELKGILQSIHRQVDRVEEGVATVRDTTVRMAESAEEMLHRFETPLAELAALANAVSRAAASFLRIFLR